MTFEQLEGSLPNGFHDAELLGLQLDYRARLVTLELTWMSARSSTSRSRQQKVIARPS